MPTNEYLSLIELRDVIKDNDWQQNANCIGVDSELFVPVDDLRGRSVAKHYEKARQYCYNCTVRAECLAFAHYNNMGEGLWGGFTPKQRKSLHKKLPVKHYFDKKDSNNGRKI